MDNSPTRKESI